MRTPPPDYQLHFEFIMSAAKLGLDAAMISTRYITRKAIDADNTMQIGTQIMNTMLTEAGKIYTARASLNPFYPSIWCTLSVNESTRVHSETGQLFVSADGIKISAL